MSPIISDRLFPAENPFAVAKNPFAAVENPFAAAEKPFAAEPPFTTAENPFAAETPFTTAETPFAAENPLAAETHFVAGKPSRPAAKLHRRIALLLGAVLLLASCTSRPAELFQRESGEVFHTTYHLTYAAPQSLHDTILNTLRAFDASLSMFNPASTLSRVNIADTRPVDVSTDVWVCHLLERAMAINALTDGAFDMSVAPLVNYWGFGYETQSRSPQALDSIRRFVGPDKWSYADGFVTKTDARVRLDASAIAKGYACDVVGRLLESLGVRHYLVEVGGEIRMAGHNPKGELWAVGVDRPDDDTTGLHHTLQTVVRLTDRGMATSGNYRRYYYENGQKVSHTINPKTGMPAASSVLGATVIARDCLTADALATSFMVMGLEQAQDFCRDRLLPADSTVVYLIYSEPGSDHLKTWQNRPF